MKRSIPVLFALLLCWCLPVSGDQTKIKKHNNAIPERYMVLLSDEVLPADYDRIANDLAEKHGFTVIIRWDRAPLGFVCTNLKASKVDKLAGEETVRIIEEDFTSQVEMSATLPTNTGGQDLWHLDRLDERTRFTLDGTYDRCPEGTQAQLTMPCCGLVWASSVAYIIDTGVRTDHEQLAGRVIRSQAFDNDQFAGYVDTTNACTTVTMNPPIHGTAVASVLAGSTIGAARPYVISLRVSDCNGFIVASRVVNAVRWIRGLNDPYAGNPGVVNFSGGQTNWAFSQDFVNLNYAVESIPGYIPFFTSADNYAGDACNFSPNSMAYDPTNPNGPKVFTVGAIDRNDNRWQIYDNGVPRIGPESGSNGGRCVSAYAPATDIYVALNVPGSTNSYTRLTGTSFASPLAAGLALRYMETSDGDISYPGVYGFLRYRASLTGSVVGNVATVEYWMCRNTANGTFMTYRSNPGVCPAEYPRGVDLTSTPIHFAATNNESQAGILYSDFTCP